MKLPSPPSDISGHEAHLLRRLEPGDHIGAAAEVVMPKARSPLRPRASIWRAKIFEPHVVARRGDGGGIGGQRDRRNRRAILDVADGELGREMLRVAGTAAIAEKEDLAAAADAGDPGIQHAPEFRPQSRTGGRRHGHMLCEFALQQAHRRSPTLNGGRQRKHGDAPRHAAARGAGPTQVVSPSCPAQVTR